MKTLQLVPRLRRPVQILALLLFVGLLAITSWRAPGTGVPADPSGIHGEEQAFPVELFGWLDPLVSIQAALAGRRWVEPLVVAAGTLALTLLLGRVFCGWVCPFGTCLELGDDLANRKVQRRWATERRLRGVKYLILTLILVAALLGQNLVFVFDPYVWATRLFTFAFFPLGLQLADLVFGWSRPLLDRLGMIGLARASFDVPLFGWLGVLSLGLYVGLLMLGRFQRRFWCRVLCPLGALLGLVGRYAPWRRRVDPERCTHCNACLRHCETGALSQDPLSSDPGECIQCQRCVEVCAFDAARFRFSASAEGQAPAIDLNRRSALAAVGTGLVGGAWLAFEPRALLAAERVLRPPGALPEPDFLALCVRCGLCSRACPTQCLQPSLLEAGPAGLLTPVPVMRIGPCDPNCTACGRVCPTHAIRLLDPKEKPFARIGTAVIDRSRCIAWEQGKACLVCDENCPWGALEFEDSAEGVGLPSVTEKKCNGCGQCEKACPIEGTSAIIVISNGQLRLAEGSYAEEAANQGFVAEEKKEPWM